MTECSHVWGDTTALPIGEAADWKNNADTAAQCLLCGAVAYWRIGVRPPDWDGDIRLEKPMRIVK